MIEHNKRIRTSLALAALMTTFCAAPPRASFAADAPPAAAAAAAPKATIPASIVDAGELAENIYDAATAGDWATVTKKLAALKDAAAKAKDELAGAPDERQKLCETLDRQLTELATAAAAKNARDTRIAANRLTLTFADLSVPFHPKCPADVTRLDYLGREIEIWAAANDTAKLKSTATDLADTWARLRDDVNAHGGAAQARTFGDLVTKLTAARAVKEYADLAKPILDEVDNLEHVYGK